MRDKFNLLRQLMLMCLGLKALSITDLYDAVVDIIPEVTETLISFTLGQLAYEGQIHGDLTISSNRWLAGPGRLPDTSDRESIVLMSLRKSPRTTDKLVTDLAHDNEYYRYLTAYCIGRLEAQGKIRYNSRNHKWYVV